MDAVIRHPEGVAAGVAAATSWQPPGVEGLESIVQPSVLRSPEERLAVYAETYFNRLIRILREQYVGLDYALGADFRAVMTRYLHGNPSRHYRLAPLGRKLPHWLPSEALDRHDTAFLSELAMLECAVRDTFDERGSDVLAPESMAAIPPEEWANVCLELIPACRLVASTYPVNRFFTGVIKGEKPALPSASASWTLVWRQEYRVWRSSLCREQYLILKALQGGQTLGLALEACIDAGGDPERVLGEVSVWFRDWTADGVFRPLHKG